MKKVLGILAIAGAAASANANVKLYDNGPVFDIPGPPAVSQLVSPPGSVFGYGAQGGTINNTVADDFTVPAPGWNVKRLTFFMYQTGAGPANFTFTGVSFDIVTDITTPWTNPAPVVPGNGGFVAFRRLSTDLTGTTRAIYALEVPVSITLTPGTYWLRWNATGTLASGPWQPPVVPHGPGNAMQSIGGGAFAAIQNGTYGDGEELPFSIWGEVIPAPGSLALLGLGGLIAGRRRR